MSLKSSSLKTKNHSAFKLFYHLVLSVKYRHKCINSEMLDRLEQIFRDLLPKWGCQVVEFGGEEDHIHVLFEAEPTCAPISKMVQNWKSVSARKIRAEFSEYLEPYFWKPYFWNRAYGVISTGGRANIETLLLYIQNQDDPRHLKPPLTSE